MKQILILFIAFFATSNFIFSQTSQTSADSTKTRNAASIEKYMCPEHHDVVQHVPGKCPNCGRPLITLSQKEQMKAEVVKLYTCTMHPNIALTKNGTCPKCGKPLVEKKQLKKT
jgi:hypothetical protein